MNILLEKGESIEVVFEFAEQVFIIEYGLDKKISVILTSGIELDPDDDNISDGKIIYKEKVI